MTETAVHCLLETEVVEGVNEVSPVEVGIDAEHLTEYLLAYVKELGWESTALSNPFTRSGKI